MSNAAPHRRKVLPKLPLSVFTPPNSGTSDRFPLPPSPSAVHPTEIIDGQAKDVDDLKSEGEFGKKCVGGVLCVDGLEGLKTIQGDSSIIATSINVSLEDILPTVSHLVSQSKSQSQSASTPSKKTHLSTTISENSPKLLEGISQALNAGLVVDVCANFGGSDAGWEVLEELIGKTLGTQEEERKGSLVLSNVLPPPASLELPIVKLLHDPSYQAYQNAIASLSLNSQVYLKFVPPAWSPTIPDATPNNLSQDAKEWKRRIKMYLGFAVEAFGCQRIIFGSGPALPSTKPHTEFWYEIARESIAELGIEQEDIDAVFSGNAKAVYTT